MKQTSVDVDKSLEDKATIKAAIAKLPASLNGLVNYLLGQYSEDLLKVDFKPKTLVWSADARTTIRFDTEVMKVAKAKFKDSRGFSPSISYLVNFLLSNFVKNN